MAGTRPQPYRSGRTGGLGRSRADRIDAPELYASYAASKDIEPGVAIPVRMDVYLLINPEQAKKFPERGQRSIEWLAIEEAAERVDDSGLANVLNRLKSEGLPE